MKPPSALPRLASLPIILFCLSNCATASGSCDLISVVEYDDAFTQKLVAEIAATPKESAIRAYLSDQTRLRDQIRACKGKA